MSMIHEITAGRAPQQAAQRKGRGESQRPRQDLRPRQQGRQGPRGGTYWKPGHEGGQTADLPPLPQARLLATTNFERRFHIVNLVDLEPLRRRRDRRRHRADRSGLVPDDKQPVKILGDGEITKKLTVVAGWYSKSAHEKITEAGGDGAEPQGRGVRVPQAQEEVRQPREGRPARRSSGRRRAEAAARRARSPRRSESLRAAGAEAAESSSAKPCDATSECRHRRQGVSGADSRWSCRSSRADSEVTSCSRRSINIFRVPELRNKVLFTLFMLAIYRIGYHVPHPGRRPGATSTTLAEAAAEATTAPPAASPATSRSSPAATSPRARSSAWASCRTSRPRSSSSSSHRRAVARKAAEGRRDRPQEDPGMDALRHRPAVHHPGDLLAELHAQHRHAARAAAVSASTPSASG